jgi:D-glycero-alpha-D-manno-heptose-7-phosphate kinase
MITTRTPLRISLVGGGTDMPSFYERHGGAVVSMAISKYIYISINQKFDGRIRLSYSRTENVDKASDLKHDLARAVLQMFDLKGVEITSVSDIPGEGSGLGSSSSFTVGLLNAISKYCGHSYCSPSNLAEMAYLIEMGCGHALGKQDHYAAAYGGLHYYQFNKDGSVCVAPLLSKEIKEGLEKQLLLFWTGKTRKASVILKQQAGNVSKDGLAEFAALDLRDMAKFFRSELCIGDYSNTGYVLRDNWELKKKLANGITNPWIDDLYEKALNEGAVGGKLCGAGGGGFLILFADPKHHYFIEKAINLRRIPFHIEEEGSKAIYENPIS